MEIFQKAEMALLNETKHLSVLCLIHCNDPYPAKPRYLLFQKNHDNYQAEFPEQSSWSEA